MKKTCVFVSLMLVMGMFFIGYPMGNLGEPESKTWKLKSESGVQNNPSLIHYAWETLRPPYGALDKIVLHRVVDKYRPPGGGKNKDRVIFLLPGTWGIGGWSEIADPNINTMLYLANNGYDVYTMDYRSSNIPNMEYEQFSQYGIDISTTADWTYGVFIGDIEACVTKIQRLARVKKVFLGGFSRGGILMFIYASKYPRDLRGLICLDGGIKDYPPTGTPLDEATYNQMIMLFKAGLLPNPFEPGTTLPFIYGYDTVYYESWKLAGIFPYAKKLAGEELPAGFGVISDFVANDAHHIWDFMGLGEGIFTNYYGGYIDRDVLVKVLNESTQYFPSIQTLESSQLMAYDDVPYFDYDDNPIYLPAIAFCSTLDCIQGICLIDAVPNMTKSDDVTIIFLPGYGHIDVLYGTNSLDDVKKPMLQWLNNH